MQDQNENLKYFKAQRRLKQLKGFYSHLAVYLVINPMIIYGNSKKFGFDNIMTYSTAILWGLVVIIHAISIFFFRNWEDKKMNELIDKMKEKDGEISS